MLEQVQAINVGDRLRDDGQLLENLPLRATA
jgi:hypothetical protein